MTPALLKWFADNKDGLVAIAALLSPVIAVIGTVIASRVSYRAVVTGPRIQREIAREQFALTRTQLALQEAQMLATLLGAADQKWIEDFRMALAELIGLVTERGLILEVRKETGDDEYEIDRAIELGHRFDPLRARIGLLVGPSGGQLLEILNHLFNADGRQKRTELTFQVFNLASQIIEQRQVGIAARITAAGRVAET